MKLNGYDVNILSIINQPKKFAIAFKLLCKRNNLHGRDVSRELDYHRETIERWKMGYTRISQATCMTICATFGITAKDLAELVMNPDYIEEIAPRKFDIDLNETPKKRFHIYSTRYGYIEYVRRTPEGGFNLDTRDIKLAHIFQQSEIDPFIEAAPKKFILRAQIIVEKMVAYNG